MNRDAIETLMDRWMNDVSFRAELRANPEAAVKASGVTLTVDELAALKNFDFSASDDELHARVSKMA